MQDVYAQELHMGRQVKCAVRSSVSSIGCDYKDYSCDYGGQETNVNIKQGKYY
jgi:hypothetical protein